ncbi:MAG: DUF1489 domain-containing protein [Paracoccaceae bacterium]|mgnify:FL=1|jgi:hypothetical protein|nr:DUF1489 domain-containing protein [Paracoccaceae bacterium]
MKYINLVKINVGSSSVKDVKEWQASNKHKWPDGLPRHITRMWPKRQVELLAGGSIYWVIKGYIMARQKITGMEEYRRHDGVRCCALIFDPIIFETESIRKRPFQGWRYLAKEDSPIDLLIKGTDDDHLPIELLTKLADIGVR